MDQGLTTFCNQVAQGRIERVLTHWLMGSTDTREDELTALGVGVEALQDIHRLPGKRDDVRSLCLTGHIPPLGSRKIDISPFSLPQLSWAHEQHWSQLKGSLRHKGPLVAPESAQELTDCSRLGHTGEVLGLWLLQRTCEVLCGISISSPRGNGIAEDPAGMRPCPVCCLNDPSLLKLPKRRQKDGRTNVTDRQVGQTCKVLLDQPSFPQDRSRRQPFFRPLCQ